jgi:anti-sigma factor RsiW
MGLFCSLRDGRLSRLVDGELPLAEYRRLQAHVQGCSRCAARVAAFREVGDVLGQADGLALAVPVRDLALPLAAVAALVASLALNLWLPREAAGRELPGLALPHAPSEALSEFCARVGEAGGR